MKPENIEAWNRFVTDVKESARENGVSLYQMEFYSLESSHKVNGEPVTYSIFDGEEFPMTEFKPLTSDCRISYK